MVPNASWDIDNIQHDMDMVPNASWDIDNI